MLGSGLASIVAFAAMPIYTRYLAPNQFGYFDLANTFGTIAAALIYADVWVGVMRLSMRDSSIDRWLGPGIGLFTISTLLLALTTLIVWLLLDPKYLWLVFLTTVARSAANFWGFAARGSGLVRLFAATGALNAVVTLATSVAGLQFLSLEAGALFLGMATGSVLQVILIEMKLRIVGHIRAVNRPLWSRELVHFTLPLGINSVAFWLFTSAGRVAVANEMGLSDNGIYAAAAKLGGLVTVVSGVVTLVWQQVSFEGSDKGSLFYRKGSALAALLYGAGGAIAVPLGVWFYRFTVDDRYRFGWVTVPGFLIVAVLAGYSNFIGNIFYALERTAALFVSTVVCLLVVLVTTFLFVREFGINGANFALILGYIANIGVRHLMLSRRARLALPLINICLATAGVAVVGTVSVLVGAGPALLAALVFSILFALWTVRFGGLLEVSTGG
jgi:O-antigen/teichoic acid export membrane protein